MKKIIQILCLCIFTPGVFATATIFNCETDLGNEQKIYATLLSNLELQLIFKQGKVEAGHCRYQLISKVNELTSKAAQVKIKYQLGECPGLSKSFRPRKNLTITYAPARQTDAVEIHALEDRHPQVCKDKNLNSKQLIKSVL